MDISYITGNQKFNYRVCAIMIDNGRILAMRDERSPYYYLPGGRVMMGETAEHAVIREVGEELGIAPEIVRPLWLNQAFFSEDVDKLNYHELCVYFLSTYLTPALSKKAAAFPFRRAGEPTALNGCRSSGWKTNISTRFS